MDCELQEKTRVPEAELKSLRALWQSMGRDLPGICLDPVWEVKNDPGEPCLVKGPILCDPAAKEQVPGCVFGCAMWCEDGPGALITIMRPEPMLLAHEVAHWLIWCSGLDRTGDLRHEDAEVWDSRDGFVAQWVRLHR